MEYMDNLHNHTDNECCDYSKNTIYTILSLMIIISCAPSFSQIFNHCCQNLKHKYNIYFIPIKRIGSNDNLLFDECSICLEKYIKKDKIISLDCNHTFHKSCILLWLNENNSCPHCRENII